MLRDTLAQVDIFAPYTDEALRLTSTTTVEDAIDAFADLVDTVIIKRGSAGATAVQRGRRYDIAGIPLAAVDTTGAGDCLNAGFIHAQLGQPSLRPFTDPVSRSKAPPSGRAVVRASGWWRVVRASVIRT